LGGPLLAGSNGGWLGGTEGEGGQKGTRHDGMGILVVSCHCHPVFASVFLPAVSFGMLGCEQLTAAALVS